MTFFPQILGVTADNASNNNKMIDHLAVLNDTFPGAANQTWCFAHILNLVAKSVLRQFEAPKKGKVVVNDIDGDKEMEIDSNDDEASDNEGGDGSDKCDDADDEDEDDGLPDELDELSEEELSSVKPIRLVLTKVSQL